ncbi:MAG: homogentisate 1,2-dioxygenase [Phycisphaerae bacterium]|nr:homogentisate 1,2-dioxygenase [Phycisphaerae bacterium]
MAYYTKLGKLPSKRHVQFRAPNGRLYSEEVFGTEGFTGPTSTLYHINAPTQVSGWEPLYDAQPEYAELNVMRMRHTRSSPMPTQGDPITGRVVLYGNADVEMGVCVPAEGMDYHYKSVFDDCLFVHHGRGTLYTMFGAIPFGPKDYLVIPKGTIYRLVFDKAKANEPANRFVFMEAVNGSLILPPPRYLAKKSSQFLEHAPFCERDLRLPQLPMTFDERGEFEVRIKSRGWVHSYTHAYHPLDVVGWDGCVYPYAFNIDDFSPIVGKHHLPPPIHQTFEAHNFVICSFCPRLLDFHPDAIVVPYNHSNLDSDEVLYYVEGNYKARRGIESGSLTLHPQGIPHGPHPGTVESTIGMTHTDELAVMCDTFRPLVATRAAVELDEPLYPASWDEGALTASSKVRAPKAAKAAAESKAAKQSSKGKTARRAPARTAITNTWD